MTRLFLLLFLLFICALNLGAQYLETFTGQNGKGLVNAICPAGTTNISNCGSTCTAGIVDNTSTCTVVPPSFSGTNWTIGLGPSSTFFTDAGGFGFEFGSPDDFGVVSEQIQVDDPDQEICWVSPTLDISAAGAVSIAIDVSQANLESGDYVRGDYSLNGGAFVAFETQSGAFAATQLNTSGLTGTTLKIRACAFTNGTSDQIFIDNVSVPQAGVVVCPSITFTSTPTNTCPGANNGQIAVSGVTGGTGPYMYSKDNGANYQSGATFTGLPANTYQVVVKDANGCTSGASSVVVGTFASPSCNISGNDFVCNNTSDIIYSGPAGMNSYSWSISGAGGSIPGSTTGSSVAVTTGNFITDFTLFLTVTDGNGCSSTCSKQAFNYLLKPPADISVSPGTTICFGATLDLSIAAAASSTVAWSGEGIANPNGNPSTMATPTTTGPHTYSVIVTTDYGCSNTDEVMVTVNSCNIDFSGKIIFSNNNALGVKDALLNLTGSATGSDLSDVNGDFFISTAVGSGSFTLKPSKTVNKLNGVTAADATAIQQHVANSVPITNLYKQVAADVNKTNSITTLDASVITQALLGNPAALAQFKTSWRFVPTSHTMSNPPWGFPEQRTFTNINASQMNQDFYGIKTGDVVTTFANPSNFGADNPMILNVQDQVLESGKEITIGFNANQLADLAAFQFALKFDVEKLELADIQPLNGLPLTADNFGTFNIAEGEIRAVWSQAEGANLEEAAPVFVLKFKVLQVGGKLSEALNLDETTLPALAYNSDLAESGVELNYLVSTNTGDPASAGGLHLFQNRPNPFNGVTAIVFVLPKESEAQLRVYDATGRVLFSQKKNYAAGRHEEIFDLEGVTGVLWYELITPFGILTKKMVATQK